MTNDAVILTPSAVQQGMKVARAKGRLRGKQPKLTRIQARHLVELNAQGVYTTAELAELFNVSRATVWRTIQREPTPANDPQRPFARTPLRES
jgi:DNA invertase Pin-like site-specific DNA recombinase